MLEFVAEGKWLSVVPVPVVAEYLTIGLIIFASCRNLIDHPQSQSQSRKVHDHPDDVPRDRFPGGVHVVGLVRLKTPNAIARRLFPPIAIRSSSGLA